MNRYVLLLETFGSIVTSLTRAGSPPLLKATHPGIFIHPPSRGNPTAGLTALTPHINLVKSFFLTRPSIKAADRGEGNEKK
jgi:hypothetical protein